MVDFVAAGLVAAVVLVVGIILMIDTLGKIRHMVGKGSRCSLHL